MTARRRRIDRGGYGDAFMRGRPRRPRRTTGYARVYDMYGRPIRRERGRPAPGYDGPFGRGARGLGRPARGFPARGVHSYDLDYGRQAGGPETDYSGRAGYPVPEPGWEPAWEPPRRGVYSPDLGLGRRSARRGAIGRRGARYGEPAYEDRSPEEDREWFGLEDDGRGRRRGSRRRIRGRRQWRARGRRARSRPPRHWSTEEPPGWRG